MSCRPGNAVAPKAPKKKVDPLDEAIAAQEGYVYNPIGKRDPFRSFLSMSSRDSDAVPRTPLQQYEIDLYFEIRDLCRQASADRVRADGAPSLIGLFPINDVMVDCDA